MALFIVILFFKASPLLPFPHKISKVVYHKQTLFTTSPAGLQLHCLQLHNSTFHVSDFCLSSEETTIMNGIPQNKAYAYLNSAHTGVAINSEKSIIKKGTETNTAI